VNAAALASNAVTTAKIADDAVTAAKIADGVITPALLAAPQWVQIDLTGDIALTEDSEMIVTSSANGGSLSATGSYGVNVGYDSTNKRPYAFTAGTFLIVAQAAIGVVHSTASDITRTLRLVKNTGSVVSQSNVTYVGGGNGKTETLTIARIVTANANDYFRIGVTAGQTTGSYTSAAVSTGGVYQTYMQVIYLGA
jgi:hypothetical protein